LEDLDLKSTFTWPLLPEVLVKLLNTLILKYLAFVDAFLVIFTLFADEPLKDNFKGAGKDLNSPVLFDDEIWNKAIITLWVSWR
jgi:hypothetical protein